MLKSDSTGSLEFSRKRLNKLPALNLKQNLLKEKTSYENVFLTSKNNKMNFMENPNFNKTTMKIIYLKVKKFLKKEGWML